MDKTFLCFLLWGMLEVSVCIEDPRGTPTIAIIGGGIGGTSAAHFLRELFGDGAPIDLYEPNIVGGRLATVELNGKSYEAGGSIIHPNNEYMVNFTKMLGLKPKLDSDGLLGVFDGQSLVFESSQWSLATLAKLLWKYGLDIFKINTFTSNLLQKFSRIYSHQHSGHAFTTVEQLLQSMSPEFLDYLQESIDDELSKKGFSASFIEQFVMGAMRCNYGQTTDIQGFVGSVSMAGVMPGLWSVHGGNKLVPQGLLRMAKVNHIKAKVSQVSLKSGMGHTKYKLQGQSTEDGQAFETKYDIVIVAAPLHKDRSNITFNGFPSGQFLFEPHYHRTVATFVRGKPRASSVGLTKNDPYPSAILTCNASVFFNSIGELTPVDSEGGFDDATNYRKVFSQVPLTEVKLQHLFESYEDVKVVDWEGAYPRYSSQTSPMPPFQLFSQLYYVNGIELAASAMEMSAIGGRNVALLTYNSWYGRRNMIDADLSGKNGKDEL